jgi:hypothetical protein
MERMVDRQHTAPGQDAWQDAGMGIHVEDQENGCGKPLRQARADSAERFYAARRCAHDDKRGAGGRPVGDSRHEVAPEPDETTLATGLVTSASTAQLFPFTFHFGRVRKVPSSH